MFFYANHVLLFRAACDEKSPPHRRANVPSTSDTFTARDKSSNCTGCERNAFYFLAFGACLALAALFFFCLAASAFTCFCAACFCAAFGDLSPIIRKNKIHDQRRQLTEAIYSHLFAGQYSLEFGGSHKRCFGLRPSSRGTANPKVILIDDRHLLLLKELPRVRHLCPA